MSVSTGKIKDRILLQISEEEIRILSKKFIWTELSSEVSHGNRYPSAVSRSILDEMRGYHLDAFFRKFFIKGIAVVCLVSNQLLGLHAAVIYYAIKAGLIRSTWHLWL